MWKFKRDEVDGRVRVGGNAARARRPHKKAARWGTTTPRPLEQIEADIRTVKKEILAMLAEVAG